MISNKILKSSVAFALILTATTKAFALSKAAYITLVGLTISIYGVNESLQWWRHYEEYQAIPPYASVLDLALLSDSKKYKNSKDFKWDAIHYLNTAPGSNNSTQLCQATNHHIWDEPVAKSIIIDLIKRNDIPEEEIISALLICSEATGWEQLKDAIISHINTNDQGSLSNEFKKIAKFIKSHKNAKVFENPDITHDLFNYIFSDQPPLEDINLIASIFTPLEKHNIICVDLLNRIPNSTASSINPLINCSKHTTLWEPKSTKKHVFDLLQSLENISVKDLDNACDSPLWENQEIRDFLIAKLLSMGTFTISCLPSHPHLWNNPATKEKVLEYIKTYAKDFEDMKQNPYCKKAFKEVLKIAEQDFPLLATPQSHKPIPSTPSKIFTPSSSTTRDTTLSTYPDDN